MSGPCAWTLDTSAVPAWGDAEEAQQATATAVATYVLWALSGRRFGICDVTARPVLSRNAQCGLPVTVPLVPSTAVTALLLPGPVVEITEVLIDGDVLPDDEYQLIDDVLYRSGAAWPTAQNLGRADTEPGTWSVTYKRGTPLPIAGQYAAGILAGEVLKAIRNTAGCRLPSRARSVTREGVDMQLLDPFAFLDQGRIGIPEVDMWLVAVNPNKIKAAPVVWSPDFGGALR